MEANINSMHYLIFDYQQLAYEMMADLGTGRRERISTADFKENIRAFVPAAEIEDSRKANVAGTEENRIARKAAPQLQAWNSECTLTHFLKSAIDSSFLAAYKSLKDDGTAEENLREVNEGLGQTHRARLQVFLILYLLLTSPH